MHEMKPSNFKIKLKLGFQPVVVYDQNLQRYAIGLLAPDLVQIEGLLTSHANSNQVKWQSRFPISDLLRLGIESATLKVISQSI